MRYHKIILIAILIFCSPVTQLMAQPEAPPRPVEIITVQNLGFGTVILGDGDVIISSDGSSRTTTGNVFTIGADFNHALFDIYANPGTIIRLDINGGNDFLLEHTQSSATFTCELSDADLHNSTVAHNDIFTMPLGYNSVEMSLGGTLKLTSSNPSGSYFGTYYVGVIYE